MNEATRKALSMTAAALRRDLAAAGVLGSLAGWTKDELIREWLELNARKDR